MRSILFVVLCVVGLTLPWWVLLAGAVVYALRYPAYELLMLSVFLDAYLGAPVSFLPFPAIYTCVAIALILLAEATKPLLSFYEHE